MRVELRGREAQCPLCDRVFTSDSTCEQHKRYGAKSTCVDPESIGMVTKAASMERGFFIYTMPIPEELQWWKQSSAEKVPAGPQTLTCTTCGVVWERPAQRGRKPKQCQVCKESSG